MIYIQLCQEFKNQCWMMI